MNPIPYGKQHITEEDIEEVIAALNDDFLTQGPRIVTFEKAFANYVEAKYAVAVSNGTAALHLCAMAMNIKPGQKVITSPITFAASANCIRYCGGEVVFGDINPDTYLLDIESVKELLNSVPKGTYAGIIPVDFAGRPVNLEEYRALADDFGLWIIEDACHAPGGYFFDSKERIQKCGNGAFADVAIFSFHPVKHIASGEGGMITTNNKEVFYRLLELRTHGITRNQELYKNSPAFAASDETATTYPGWYMEMQELGYNYRITDIQAALGKSQLARADEGLIKRRAIAKKYYEAFENNPRITSQSGVVEGHAYHLYVIEVEDRLGLYNFLRENNIFAQVHYIPVHLMPYYKDFGFQEGDLPKAEKYYRHCISLPMYPTLKEQEIEYVINVILKYFQ